MGRADFDVMAELFGSAVQQALDPGPVDESARLHGELVVCGEVARHLNTYVPHPMPDMPPELRHFGAMTWDEKRAALDGPAGPAFARYRFEVTDVEASNAARLQVLVSTVQTLARLRNRAPDPQTVDRVLETVGSWIERIWRVSPPLEGETRHWCTRQTRRLDVLPAAWRGL